MKHNITMAFVKFGEDLLYFQHFMQILYLPQISDYLQLKIKFDIFFINFKSFLSHLP